MPKYRCNNKKCINFGKLSDNIEVHKKYTSSGVIDLNVNCPECDKKREVIEKNKGFCTSIHGSNNICNK